MTLFLLRNMPKLEIQCFEVSTFARSPTSDSTKNEPWGRWDVVKLHAGELIISNGGQGEVGIRVSKTKPGKEKQC